jgi:hypothetical protein
MVWSALAYSDDHYHCDSNRHLLDLPYDRSVDEGEEQLYDNRRTDLLVSKA